MNTNIYKRLIVLDGPDGVGKTSVLPKLKAQISNLFVFHPINPEEFKAQLEDSEFQIYYQNDIRIREFAEEVLMVQENVQKMQKKWYEFELQRKTPYAHGTDAFTLIMGAAHSIIGKFVAYLLDTYPEMIIVLDRSWASFYAYQIRHHGGSLVMWQMMLLHFFTLPKHYFVFTALENKQGEGTLDFLSGQHAAVFDNNTLYHDANTNERNGYFRELLTSHFPGAAGDINFHDIPINEFYSDNQADWDGLNEKLSDKIWNIIKEDFE